jgi:hypothetical protein
VDGAARLALISEDTASQALDLVRRRLNEPVTEPSWLPQAFSNCAQWGDYWPTSRLIAAHSG